MMKQKHDLQFIAYRTTLSTKKVRYFMNQLKKNKKYKYKGHGRPKKLNKVQ